MALQRVPRDEGTQDESPPFGWRKLPPGARTWQAAAPLALRSCKCKSNQVKVLVSNAKLSHLSKMPKVCSDGKEQSPVSQVYKRVKAIMKPPTELQPQKFDVRN